MSWNLDALAALPPSPDGRFTALQAVALLEELKPFLAEEGLDFHKLRQLPLQEFTDAINRAIDRSNLARFTP